MLPYFFIIVGYFFSLLGSTYIIGYLNLIQMGYNFNEYVNFIIRRPECWLLPIGSLMLAITIILKGDTK